jgi:hypothetical protein
MLHNCEICETTIFTEAQAAFRVFLKKSQENQLGDSAMVCLHDECAVYLIFDHFVLIWFSLASLQVVVLQQVDATQALPQAQRSEQTAHVYLYVSMCKLCFAAYSILMIV